LLYYLEQRFVVRDVGHAVSVVDEANESPAVDDGVQGHPPEFEQIDFLFVGSGNPLVRVGQAGKGKLVLSPKVDKSFPGIRADRQDFRVPRGELCIPISQARQLRPAVRSKKAAQESQHDNFLPAEIGQAYSMSIQIGQLEVRGFLPIDQIVSHLA
jgi:hypothetical protein